MTGAWKFLDKVYRSMKEGASAGRSLRLCVPGRRPTVSPYRRSVHGHTPIRSSVSGNDTTLAIAVASLAQAPRCRGRPGYRLSGMFPEPSQDLSYRIAIRVSRQTDQVTGKGKGPPLTRTGGRTRSSRLHFL